jgi:hypothetical protein
MTTTELTAYPADPPAGAGVGKAAAVTLTPAAGDIDVIGYYYGVGVASAQPTRWIKAGGNGVVTALINPLVSGRAMNVLTVQAVDRAGNRSVPATFGFKANPAAEPVGRWRLDDGTGTTATDDTGTHPATLGGGASWVTGRNGTGSALSLNGTTGYAQTAGPVVHTDRSFTVAAWVKLTHTDTGRWVSAVSQNGSNFSAFVLSYDGGHWAFAMHSADVTAPDATRIIAPQPPPAANTWTHLVAVYDGAAHEMRLYVNGSLAGTAAYTSGYDAPGALGIGRARAAGAWSDWWPGQVDDIRAWDRVVFGSEIASLASDGAIRGPAAWWPVNEGGGITLADASNNNHPATLAGGASWTPGRDGSGSAVSLNGTGGYAETAGPIVHTDRSFTASAWVKLAKTDTGGWTTVVSQNGRNFSAFVLAYDGAGHWAFAMHGGDVIGPPATRLIVNQPVTAGVWTHLAAIYDAGTRQMRLYVNGALAGTTAYTSGYDATATVDVGRARVDATWRDWWPGAVTDVRMWDRPLADDEVALLLAAEAA